jgi:GNAT superfamily N-acetyltransferase
MDPDLVRRAIAVNWRNLALGHDAFRAEGAIFVRNIQLPIIHDANFIYNMTATTTEAVDRLLDRAQQEYAHASQLSFRVDPSTPHSVEAHLALASTRAPGSALVLLLDGPLRGKPGPADIRPVTNDRDWAAYAELKRMDWREHAGRSDEDPDDVRIPDGFVAASRSKCPPARYFLAYQDGVPCGFFSSWEGFEGVGQVEDLFVLPAYRRRGVATALVHHCVADARAQGAGPIVIVADPGDTPKNMYTAMGWRPAAACRLYGVAVSRP